MPTSIDITFTHYNRPPTKHLHFRVLTCVFQVHLLWRTNECADIRIFSSQLLPARISIFDQNQEAEIFKFRWCRQSEFKNQLNLTSKILTRMLHITNINLFIKHWSETIMIMHIDVNYVNVNAFYFYFTPILVEIDVKDIFDVLPCPYPQKGCSFTCQTLCA